jgi:hypothetical protein
MARQTLIFHTAGCHDCGASVDAKNAVAWAHNHVSRNPGHQVELSLGYQIANPQTAAQTASSQKE